MKPEEAAMALVALANKGNFLHVFDFRVKPGTGDRFIAEFDEFDYGADNPMHKSPAQVRDGVLCRDTEDPNHFYLIGEWSDIEAHARIREQLAAQKLAFFGLIEGIEEAGFVPTYAEIVSSTPQEILDSAAE
jgi:hypothetical protein